MKRNARQLHFCQSLVCFHQRRILFIASLVLAGIAFVLHLSLLSIVLRHDEQVSFAMKPDAESTTPLIVVAPTFYTTTEETRYRLGIEACQNAAKYHIRVILVDGSPQPEIRNGLEEAGRGYVQVLPQTAKGRKGAALREAIQHAHQQSGERSMIAFQELEKVDMFRHWLPMIKFMTETNADVIVPKRSHETFRSTYPIEQYHCESFANSYLNSLSASIGMTPIDWTIGPVAFKYNQAEYWINFDGELWDAQLVPLVKAHLSGAKVEIFEIDYLHPKTMKEEEEGVAKWNEKRLMQLNFLKDTVGKLMVENAKSSKAYD